MGPKGINWTEAFQFYCETIDDKLPLYQDIADKFNVSKTETRQWALQSQIFLSCVICENKKVWTANLSQSFELIKVLKNRNSDYVTSWGIEPQLQGWKPWVLTVRRWGRPSDIFEVLDIIADNADDVKAEVEIEVVPAPVGAGHVGNSLQFLLANRVTWVAVLIGDPGFNFDKN